MVQLTRAAARREASCSASSRRTTRRQRQGSHRRRDDRGRRARGPDRAGRTTIVEATSGNTGIALAFVCAAKGYELMLTLPQGMSREREGLLRLYGARVEITESLGGMHEAVEAASAIAGGATSSCPTSSRTRPTPRRIAARPARRSGARRPRRRLRRRGRHRRDDHWRRRGAQGAQPRRASSRSSRRLGGARAAPRGPHKIQGIGAGFVPAVLNRDVLDEMIAVDDEDAIETARLLARREGVLPGISGGAALWAAIEARQAARSSGKRIVVILPDSGERYVSTPFFAP